jgi:hypothetical protein
VSRFFGAVPLQNGYVVRDLHRAMEYWTTVLGVGPFFLVEHAHMEDYEAYGEPMAIDMSVAIAMTAVALWDG